MRNVLDWTEPSGKERLRHVDDGKGLPEACQVKSRSMNETPETRSGELKICDFADGPRVADIQHAEILALKRVGVGRRRLQVVHGRDARATQKFQLVDRVSRLSRCARCADESQ
jgi:hypothetical protein